VNLPATLPYQDGLTFGSILDTDDVADPETGVSFLDGITRFMELLGPAPRLAPSDPAQAAEGQALFTSVGCASCHVPVLRGTAGDVPLYSDLLLHEVLPEGMHGIEDASANELEFRTAPLWGIRLSAPYLHDGRADTLRDAILGHDGEALSSRDKFQALSEQAQAALLAFLETL
jgi:CxxC motif-containing protein (DUF1111 family)